MTRDLITVEREYDGERCGENCSQLVAESTGCCGVSWVPVCEAFHEEICDYKRCPACLATPPPRVLTPEMLEAVHQGEAALSMQPCRCAEGFVCSRCQGLRALRAAFGIEEGK